MFLDKGEDAKMKDIQLIYETCKEKLDNLGIEIGTVKYVRINRRAKKRWGICRCINSVYGQMFGIEIAERLLQDDVDDKSTENTMLHELLHTCKGCQNHGAEWKRLANKVNKAYGYNIKRCASALDYGIDDGDYFRACKYKIICEKCGGVGYRQKKSNVIIHPERYVCKCGGRLSIDIQY